MGLEDGSFVVVKFYRPDRWSDAQILEEHAFIAELAEHEIPAVPALSIGGNTLHTFDGFRFAVFQRAGGRAPNMDDPSVREWLGRFLGRIHAVGRVKPYTDRPALDIATFGVEPRRYLLEGDWLPPELKARLRRRFAAGARPRRGSVRPRRTSLTATARRLPRRQRAVDRFGRQRRSALRRL